MVDLEIAHPHHVPYRTRQYYGPDYGDRYVFIPCAHHRHPPSLLVHHSLQSGCATHFSCAAAQLVHEFSGEKARLVDQADRLGPGFALVQMGVCDRRRHNVTAPSLAPASLGIYAA